MKKAILLIMAAAILLMPLGAEAGLIGLAAKAAKRAVHPAAKAVKAVAHSTPLRATLSDSRRVAKGAKKVIY